MTDPKNPPAPPKPAFAVGDNFELTSFSLVERCPYCGARFGEEGKMNDGKSCPHPTKVDALGAFNAMGGRRVEPATKREGDRVWTHVGGDLWASYDGSAYVDIRVADTGTKIFMSENALRRALALIRKP